MPISRMLARFRYIDECTCEIARDDERKTDQEAWEAAGNQTGSDQGKAEHGQHFRFYKYGVLGGGIAWNSMIINN